MYNGASNLADGVDKAFAFIFITSFIFIIGITAFMIWTVIKFRRSKNKEAAQFTGSTKLEIIWTVIPTIIVLIMFWYGWVGFSDMRKVPDDAMKITAIGRMWEWEFDYGDGKVSKELVIPKDQAIRLDLVSEDVNHSLFIPAFRVKEDVVPGYDNYLWFIPTEIGDFDILCTEYCGLLHSAMIANTKVVTADEFNSWLENLEATGNIPDHPGLAILKKNSCLACHSLDGAKLVGPTFMNAYGSEKVVVDESGNEIKIVVDEAYVKKAINNPNAEVVKGFSKGLMQSYENLVSDEESKQITEYLKTISDKSSIEE